jgi:hypothetical protein
MQKLILTLMLTSLFSNQVLAYYPDSDMAELSKLVDSMEVVDSSEVKNLDVKANTQAKLESEILKVQSMDADQEKKYTKKLIRKSQKNVKRAKRVTKKLLKSNRLMKKIATKKGISVELFKADLESMAKSLSEVNVKKDLLNAIANSGGLVQYLEGLKSTSENKNLIDEVLGAIVVISILFGAFFVGIVLILVGAIVAATGGAAGILIVGGALVVISAPILFLGN